MSLENKISIYKNDFIEFKEVIFRRNKKSCFTAILRNVILQFCPIFEPFGYATMKTNYIAKITETKMINIEKLKDYVLTRNKYDV